VLAWRRSIQTNQSVMIDGRPGPFAFIRAAAVSNSPVRRAARASCRRSRMDPGFPHLDTRRVAEQPWQLMARG